MEVTLCLYRLFSFFAQKLLTLSSDITLLEMAQVKLAIQQENEGNEKVRLRNPINDMK